MNPAVILALIADLYEQIAALSNENAILRATPTANQDPASGTTAEE